jgi:hypothetical protein
MVFISWHRLTKDAIQLFVIAGMVACSTMRSSHRLTKNAIQLFVIDDMVVCCILEAENTTQYSPLSPASRQRRYSALCYYRH